MNFLILYLLFLTSVQIVFKAKEIDFYAYYIPDENAIICSYRNKKYSLEGMGQSKEFEHKNGFTCLLNFKKKGIYKILLHVSQIKSTEKDLEILKHNSMDISLGNLVLAKSVNLAHQYIQPVVVKFENDNVYCSLIPECNENTQSQCRFKKAKDSIFLGKYIKLNFSLKNFSSNSNFNSKGSHTYSSFLETNDGKRYQKSDDCDPPCIFGICNEGDCACKSGYMGINCSIKLKENELRVSLTILVILFLLTILLGVILLISFYFCYFWLSRDKELMDNSYIVDVQETWDKKEEEEKA